MVKAKPANKLDSPLFCLGVFKDYVIISMGGGGKQYGLINQFKVYKREFPVKEAVYSKDLEENLMSHFSFHNQGLNYMIAAVSKFVVLYSIEMSTGTLIEQVRYEADYASDLPAVSKVKWSSDDQYIVSGGEDGTMRIFKVIYEGKDIHSLEQQIELGSHSRDINDVSINRSNQLAVSSSSDKTWRIYTIKDGKCIKRLSFSEDIGVENLQFKGALFSPDERYLYTLATKIKGKSYLIKWDAKSENFDPIDTMEAHRNPSCIMNIDYSGSNIAIGTNDGHVIGINANKMSSYRIDK